MCYMICSGMGYQLLNGTCVMFGICLIIGIYWCSIVSIMQSMIHNVCRHTHMVQLLNESQHNFAGDVYSSMSV